LFVVAGARPTIGSPFGSGQPGGKTVSDSKTRKKGKTPLSINYDTIRMEESQSLEIEAKAVEINQELTQVEISLLPSLHSMMSSSYSIIDEELHRLRGKAKTRGLDTADGKSFALLTNSLVKLANLEMNIREQSELETLDDEKIHTLAAEVLAKQIGGKGGR